MSGEHDGGLNLREQLITLDASGPALAPVTGDSHTIIIGRLASWSANACTLWVTFPKCNTRGGFLSW